MQPQNACPTDRLRIGLFGCGNWGRHILRDLVALECDVVVVTRGQQSRENAVAGGATAVVTDFSQMGHVHGAVVATPTPSRPEIIKSLLAVGISTFTEKPLANEVATAEDLVSAGDTSLFVMEKWRYHQGIQELARIARSEEFGPVLGLRTTRIGWGVNHADLDAVGVLLPHDISIVDEILDGLPTPRWAIGESVGGEPAALLGGLGESPWVIVDVSAISRTKKREVRLYCRHGVVILHGALEDHLEIVIEHRIGTPPVTIQRAITTEPPLLAELRAFVEHLKGRSDQLRGSIERSLLGVRAMAQLRQMAGFDGG